jgi:hypothetical protein
MHVLHPSVKSWQAQWSDGVIGETFAPTERVLIDERVDHSSECRPCGGGRSRPATRAAILPKVPGATLSSPRRPA